MGRAPIQANIMNPICKYKMFDNVGSLKIILRRQRRGYGWIAFISTDLQVLCHSSDSSKHPQT